MTDYRIKQIPIIQVSDNRTIRIIAYSTFYEVGYIY